MTREQQELVEAIVPVVWAIASRHFGKTVRDVEDLVQVGLEGVCKRIDRFDPDRSPFHKWAGHVAWRSMQDYLREQRPGSRGNPRPDALSLNAPTGSVFDEEWLDLLTAEDDHPRLVLEDVARLPPRSARAVTLRLAGYTGKEIGDMSGVSEARISQLVSRCRPLIDEVVAPPQQGVLLVDRTLHPDERSAILEAHRVRPGCEIISLRPRKLRKGRVVAPQGRPAKDGSLGRPVWAVELRDVA